MHKSLNVSKYATIWVTLFISGELPPKPSSYDTLSTKVYDNDKASMHLLSHMAGSVATTEGTMS